MKTFMRKLKLSFLAMLCGWIACNIAFWAGILLHPMTYKLETQSLLVIIPYVALPTGFVILLAWLVIFLPVDLIVSDGSKLRRPLPAAFCGFIAGSSVLAVQWGCSAWENDSLNRILLHCLWKGLPFLLAPGITGMVAAYIRSRDYEPLLKNSNHPETI